MVQIKDLKDQTRLAADQLPRMNWPGGKTADRSVATVRPGEILVPARGGYYQAVVLQGYEPVIATNQLFVLRLTSKAITPEYLSWYINQSMAQKYFLTHRGGTSIPMLNKQSLGALPVVVPPLATQEKILAIQCCWEEEQRITERLLTNREKLLKGVFQRLLET